MIMKQLKPSTIKRYDARQLRRHLDRLQDQFEAGSALYRIDQYAVRQLIGDAYYPLCNLNDRDMIIEAIESTYRELESR
tara:strand:- start:11017 stop:11253 length:237 start_codon:yes stop_codon:yes gene_type:complete